LEKCKKVATGNGYLLKEKGKGGGDYIRSERDTRKTLPKGSLQ